MPVTASTLVQETARAQQASATARRDASAGPAMSGGEATGGFAGLLQAMSSGAQGAAPAGSEAKPASHASTRQGENGRSGHLALRTATLAPGASEPAARDGASANRPAGSAAAPPSSVSDAAARDTAATGDPSEAAQADAREASATGADNLAQWLMQMGLIPSQTAASAADSGNVADGPDATAAAAGADAAAAQAGGGLSEAAAGSGGNAAARGAPHGARAFRIPGAAGSPGGEGPLEVGASAGAALGGRRLASEATEANGQVAVGTPPSSPGGEVSAATAGGAGAAGAAGVFDLSGLAAATSAAAALAPSAPGGAASAPAADAASVLVQAAFDDPALAGEVVMHVGRFAREGLTEASLHLNPAEMGPIRVQIALEGQQARIDFSAQHAATRELLESALPALAQSLAADGLTLSASSVVQASGAAGPADAASPSASGSGLAAQGQGSDDAAGRSSAQGGRDERGAAAGDPLRVRGHLGGGSGSEQAVRPGSSRPPDGAAAGAGLRALDLYA